MVLQTIWQLEPRTPGGVSARLHGCETRRFERNQRKPQKLYIGIKKKMNSRDDYFEVVPRAFTSRTAFGEYVGHRNATDFNIIEIEI